jgi:hypothetical protein
MRAVLRDRKPGAGLAPLPPIRAVLAVDDAAIFRATAALADHQALGRATRAAHAAAFCTPDGTIVALREDVKRHIASTSWWAPWRVAGTIRPAALSC